MRSEVAKRMMNSMPEDVKIFADKYADLVVRIHQLLKAQGINQKSLAERLGKQPSEIHKWLNGDHNFTLRSICRLEAELGASLLVVPALQYLQQQEYQMLAVAEAPAVYETQRPKMNIVFNKHWQPAENQTENLAHVA